MTNIIGLSAYFHDAACCLLRDGALVAAAQEERFSRRKHDPSLPRQAFRFCLREGGLTLADLDAVAYYERPEKKLERQLWQLWPDVSEERCLELWRAARRPMDEIRQVLGYDGDVCFVEHHEAHAASAFLYSRFPEAAILTVDGVGEWDTMTYAHGREQTVTLFESVRFPHSIGLVYSTITAYLGFAVNDGEYKVMGLAPYGRPRYLDQLRALLGPASGGDFALDMAYFDFTRSDGMHAQTLVDLLGRGPRHSHEPLERFHEDLACSMQRLLEDIMLERVRYLHDRVPVDDLCLAGGVALNCTANGRIAREGPFRRLFVQPAAGDAGGALGAAALAQVRRGGRPRPLDHVFLGPASSRQETASLIEAADLEARDFRDREDELLDATVELLEAGRVVAWFHGRMEFGPRALGARSILADPRDPSMRDRINASVKKREGFRPFAPAVLEEEARAHFDLDHRSPFMLETCQVRSALSLPAITHVDGSARVQTVSRDDNPRFARLLDRFAARTGCPILLNTSFNMKDEPIVCSAADALLSFARSALDALVLEDFLIERGCLSPALLAACAAVQDIPTAMNDRAYTFW